MINRKALGELKPPPRLKCVTKENLDLPHRHVSALRANVVEGSQCRPRAVQSKHFLSGSRLDVSEKGVNT